VHQAFLGLKGDSAYKVMAPDSCARLLHITNLLSLRASFKPEQVDTTEASRLWWWPVNKPSGWLWEGQEQQQQQPDGQVPVVAGDPQGVVAPAEQTQQQQEQQQSMQQDLQQAVDAFQVGETTTTYGATTQQPQPTDVAQAGEALQGQVLDGLQGQQAVAASAANAGVGSGGVVTAAHVVAAGVAEADAALASQMASQGSGVEVTAGTPEPGTVGYYWDHISDSNGQQGQDQGVTGMWQQP
jgi:hypothetical protein